MVLVVITTYAMILQVRQSESNQLFQFSELFNLFRQFLRKYLLLRYLTVDIVFESGT